MTVTTTSSSTTLSANSATTVWPYTFIIPDATSVVITVTDANGNPSIIAPANYTITGLGNSAGGSVTYPLSGSPLATGNTFTIARAVPYTQPTSIVNQDGFYPDVLEAALDNLEMQIQQTATVQFKLNTQGTAYDATTHKISNLVPGALPTDAATYSQVLTATTGPQGPLPWSAPTAWLAATAYTIGPPASNVVFGGEDYVCITSHTSTGSFDASKWIKIAQKGSPGSGSGDMIGANNLSDVASPATSRVNLGGTTTGVALFTAASVAAARSAISLTPGTDVQTQSTLLTSVAALSVVTGDVIYGSGTGTVARLGVGSTGQVLKVAGGLPSWGSGGSTVLDYQAFTANGTWTKPSGVSANDIVEGYIWGGGGGGASSTAGTSHGGGGGGCVKFSYRISDLNATEAVTVGAGGAIASAGGNSTFKGVTGYGGGGGVNGSGGGGGGGSLSVGGNGSSGNGGGPAGGAIGSPGVDSSFGGGGGTSGTTAAKGGDSFFGGGGGACGVGGAAIGGKSVYGGGGGGGSASGGTSIFGGNGGVADVAGTAPGGAGGGSNGGGGAAGARGEVRIWVIRTTAQ